MSENLKIVLPATGNARLEPEQLAGLGLSTAAVARRRMLLKSLGKGSAVVAAAAVPMQSLAAIGTLSVNSVDGKRCTISGTMSGVHSKETTTALCGGYSPGRYKKIENWPGYSPTNIDPTIFITGGTGSFTKNTSFNALFGAGLTIGLLTIMNNNANSDEFHWIPALLNGTAGSLAVNFPYTAKQVIDLYQTGGSTRFDALTFFKTYMEKL